ncbi:hypothetical protein R1flu_017839 [Riccia fluitans]|uniref:LAGLIDADG homing endonuclease n=1 Tax=Riccia fluitans TaxID=41844 RepID=A0ABD1ZE46_9MARC
MMKQLSMLLKCYYRGDTFKERIIFPLWKKASISMLQELQNAEEKWENLMNILMRKGITVNMTQKEAIADINNWLEKVTLGPAELQLSRSGVGKELTSPGKGRTERQHFRQECFAHLSKKDQLILTGDHKEEIHVEV